MYNISISNTPLLDPDNCYIKRNANDDCTNPLTASWVFIVAACPAHVRYITYANKKKTQ